jgi:hypothetical protein
VLGQPVRRATPQRPTSHPPASRTPNMRIGDTRGESSASHVTRHPPQPSARIRQLITTHIRLSPESVQHRPVTKGIWDAGAPECSRRDSGYVCDLGALSRAGRSPYHSEPSIERPQDYHSHTRRQARTPTTTGDPGFDDHPRRQPTSATKRPNAAHPATVHHHLPRSPPQGVTKSPANTTPNSALSAAKCLQMAASRRLGVAEMRGT